MAVREMTVDDILDGCWRWRPGLMVDIRREPARRRPLWRVEMFEEFLVDQLSAYEAGRAFGMGYIILTGVMVVDIDDGLQRIRAIGTELLAALADPDLPPPLRERVTKHVEGMTKFGVPPPTGPYLQLALEYYELLRQLRRPGRTVPGFVNNLLYETRVMVLEHYPWQEPPRQQDRC